MRLAAVTLIPDFASLHPGYDCAQLHVVRMKPLQRRNPGLRLSVSPPRSAGVDARCDPDRMAMFR